MIDLVYEGFLETLAEDAGAALRDSDILRLVAEPRAGGAASVYHGELHGIEHLCQPLGGAVAPGDGPIGFRLEFGPNYLRSTDPNLQFHVVAVESVPGPYHPNVRGGMVCLGEGFGCGTRLRPLLEQVWGVFSYAVLATDHPFNLEARDYLLDRPELLRELRAPRPLWRRPLAARVRVEDLGTGDGR